MFFLCFPKFPKTSQTKNSSNTLWLRGLVVITAQLHSTNPELRFCAGLNPARGVSKIRHGEDLWQSFCLEIRLSLVNYTTKTIHHHLHQKNMFTLNLTKMFFQQTLLCANTNFHEWKISAAKILETMNQNDPI